MDDIAKDAAALKLADKEPKKPNRFTFNIGASEFVPSWGPPPAEEQVVFQPVAPVAPAPVSETVVQPAVKTPAKKPAPATAVTPEPSLSAPSSKPSTPPPVPKEKGMHTCIYSCGKN